MKKKQTKGAAKKQEEERKLRQQQEKQMAEKLAQEKEEYLENRSSPLVKYGLMDAFQFFMVELATAGIPQGNIYEFGAQAVLKYQKILKKKKANNEEVSKFNEKVIKASPKSYEKKRAFKKEIEKPSVLPFKGELTPEEKAIIQGQNWQEEKDD